MDDQVKLLEAALQSDGEVVLRSGYKVCIRKCQLRQLGVIAQFVREVQALALTNAVLGDAITRTGGDAKALASDPLFISELLVHLDAKLYTLLSGFCNLSPEEFASLEIDEAMVVIGRIVGDNLDFFVRQVFPLVLRVLDMQTGKIEKLIPAGLPASSAA